MGVEKVKAKRQKYEAVAACISWRSPVVACRRASLPEGSCGKVSEAGPILFVDVTPGAFRISRVSCYVRVSHGFSRGVQAAASTSIAVTRLLTCIAGLSSPVNALCIRAILVPISTE